MTKVKYLKNYPFSNEFQKHLNEASIVPAKGIENLELNYDSDLHATLREYSFSVQTVPDESHRGNSL